MNKPTIRKKNGYLIVTCPECDVNFMALNNKEAEANYNRHCMFKHNEEFNK